jgi:hypothetical protein
MRTMSGSERGLVCRDSPGRRLSIQGCMSASLSEMPGGQPSIAAPIAGPWLSPQVEKRKILPKLFALTRQSRSL